MIRDANLRFALNQRPTNSLLGVSTFYALPEGGIGAVLGHDLRAVMDLGNGYPLKARFDIKTSFTSTDATLTARFAIALSNDPNFTGTPTILTASDRMTVVGGVAGLGVMQTQTFVELTMPKLPSYAGIGQRFVFLIMDITTAIALGNPLFTAGALDAHLTLDTDQELHLPPHVGGFVV